MTDTVKSGQEILQDFFSGITSIGGVDKDIALAMQRLFQQDKLTNTNISNELSKLRESKKSG